VSCRRFRPRGRRAGLDPLGFRGSFAVLTLAITVAAGSTASAQTVSDGVIPANSGISPPPAPGDHVDVNRIDPETFKAIAEQRGYKEAPVSVLLLENKPPDLVFEKLNNTFAQRHHLRVWRRPDTFEGKPVWVIAATHDTGIDFSQENRTFIHKIDPQIDQERAKVVNDLLFAGHVRSVALVERPTVPQHSQNATGDNLETDAKMAVLVLQ
jgi:hypothetical protein